MAEVVLPPRVSVETVLRNLSLILGASITWLDDDVELSASVIAGASTTFRAPTDRVFDALTALLATREVLLLPYGPSEQRMFFAIHARTLATRWIAKLVAEVDEVTDESLATLDSQSGRFVMTTIRVTHIAASQEARNSILKFSTQNNVGWVVAVPAASLFVVCDFAPNVATIYRSIRQLDVPPAPLHASDADRMVPAYFPLKHARAQVVAELLKRLLSERSDGATVPRISSDEATNQVIAIATADDAATMREVVAHVDVEPAK